MPATEPIAELDPRFSSEDAEPRSWADTSRALEAAQVYWLSTVRADGHPHVTPLIAVWRDGALHFTTGPDEQKAKNLAASPHCVLTTGHSALDAGLDVVVEGDAVRVRDDERLHDLARAWETKYGPAWHFDARDGAFHHEGHEAWVYTVAPVKAFAFGKGEPYSQTRYRFT
jgi:nitroimidazol reductase NimA-like FMN-containing flavoprotein (pyridoxamine 5'-phosphate oxidase superfamily)